MFDGSQINFLILIGSTKDSAETQMCALGYCAGGYDARPFELYFELEINVNPSASTGDGGLLELVVLSTKNAANRSGQFDISLDVQIIYEFEFDREQTVTEFDVEYSNEEEFIVNLTNTGNVDAEVLIFTSESFRGWNVVLEEPNGQDSCDQDITEFICDVDVGQSLQILVTIRTPVGAEVADTYKFTLSAEPVETGVVDRVNIEFTVNGDVSSGLFGLGIQEETMYNGVAGLAIIFFVAFAYRSFFGQRRS